MPAMADGQPALVWRRSDFSETSRIVTLITRDDGKIKALAKGAHRAASPFLGRLDFLNLVIPRFARQRSGGLWLLRDVKLVHEHRGLRDAGRFAAASHLCDVFDVTWLEGRGDPPLFDLLAGALRAIEKCPSRARATFVAGVELRFLHGIGVLPDLHRCSECGAAQARLHAGPIGRGLLCSAHRSGSGIALRAPALAWMRRIERTPGREWGDLPPPDSACRTVLGQWLATALERPLPWRRVAFESCGAPRRGELRSREEFAPPPA